MGRPLHDPLALIWCIHLGMKYKLFLALLPGIATLSVACGGGGGECAKAYDKEIECGEHSEERKEKMKSRRSEAISRCKKNKDRPVIKTAIKCSKTNSCDEYQACQLEADSESDIKEIETAITAGKFDEAMSTCRYQLKTYKSVSAFKAACDKAITASFAKLETEDARSDARYTCASSSDAKEWLAASPAMTEGCNSLLTAFKTTITKQRDTGSEYNYTDCSGYSDLVKAIAPTTEAAATLLCNEAEVADDFTEGFAELTKNIAEKKKQLPFRCTSILDPKYNKETVEKLKDSKWFTDKSLELAKKCYGGEMGTLLLSDVTSYCGMRAKEVHVAAAKYGLGKESPELQAMLDSTADKCTK